MTKYGYAKHHDDHHSNKSRHAPATYLQVIQYFLGLKVK